MELVLAGLLNEQIANVLQLSEGTVKLHRARVMQKMQVRSLPELVRVSERFLRSPKAASSASAKHRLRRSDHLHHRVSRRRIRAKAQEQGALCFLNKPVQRDTLLECLEKAEIARKRT